MCQMSKPTKGATRRKNRKSHWHWYKNRQGPNYLSKRGYNPFGGFDFGDGSLHFGGGWWWVLWSTNWYGRMVWYLFCEPSLAPARICIWGYQVLNQETGQIVANAPKQIRVRLMEFCWCKSWSTLSFRRSWFLQGGPYFRYPSNFGRFGWCANIEGRSRSQGTQGMSTETQIHVDNISIRG